MTNPTESILVTSSYVSVPAIETLPPNVVTPVTLRLVNGPSNLVAVIMPVEFKL